MNGEETAGLLNTATERRTMADQHKAEALRLVYADDPEIIARAAHHFTIAAGLRGQARFR